MARLDPFIDLLIKNGGEQLLLVPDEPVGMEKQGRQSKLSKQVITEKQLYALLTEMAPSEAADRIGKGTPATFEYAGGAGLVIVRVTPKNGKLHAQISPGVDVGAPAEVEPASPPSSGPPATDRAPAAGGGGGGRKPRLSVVVAPPPEQATTNAPNALPAEFADGRMESAQRQLGVLLNDLVHSQSSDLHLRVDEPPIFRTHGEIVRHGEDPLSGEQLDQLLLSIMPERNRLEWRESGDTDFAYEIAGLARFRVNAARDRKGSVGVFRVIPANVVTVEDMGITAEVQKLCYLTKGLVLVTGPTGSGKSTTLCSLIDLINRERSDHIITIEDPIEFVHENKKCLITQRQVHVHTESFKSALRAALREDPDIVLVGEMRDLETIAIALETAETGHLVFGTLHTTTAPSTVDRIIDQFPADRQAQIRIMLSESLKGVIAQTLCKKIGGGRVAAREILLTTPAISNLIREGKTFQIPSIIQTSKKLGMITLNDALLELVEKKVVEPDEAYMKAVEKAGFAAQLKQKGFKLTIPAEA